MQTNFQLAVEQLQKATPESIMLQLYELNSKIQSASQEDIIAIYHTLKGVDSTLPVGTAHNQIYELMQSAFSRMATFIILANNPKRIHALYNGVGYSKKLDAALKSTQD